MMLTRLRPKHSDVILKQLYAEPHDHRKYGKGHGERVNSMITLAAKFEPYNTAADLSCGNSYVMDQIDIGKRIRGDFAPGYKYTGPIEETIKEIELVDLFILGETLEHLDTPITVLKSIRDKTKYLLMSTPYDNWDDSCKEHYWAWDWSDVKSMLDIANFTTLHAFETIDSRVYGESYCYGIWLVS